MTEPVKLTQFSHGGGCGCKIAPSVLAEMLAANPSAPSAAIISGGNIALEEFLKIISSA